MRLCIAMHCRTKTSIFLDAVFATNFSRTVKPKARKKVHVIWFIRAITFVGNIWSGVKKETSGDLTGFGINDLGCRMAMFFVR